MKKHLLSLLMSSSMFLLILISSNEQFQTLYDTLINGMGA